MKKVSSSFKGLGIILIVVVAASLSQCKSVNRTGEAVREIEKLRVMSYNIHHANPPSRPDFIDIQAIVNTIKAEDPDFVALQEVDADTERSGKGNQAALIAGQLGMEYYFAKALDYQGGAYGVAILSKFPLEDTGFEKLPNAPGDDTETRVLAYATAQIPDGFRVIIASTHLDYKKDSPSRILQMERIIDFSKEKSVPMIIAGDFNAESGSKTIDLLGSYFTLSCQDCPYTIPVNKPNRTIDFIAFRHPQQKFSTGSHKVISETYASDHLPIIADIIIEK